MSTDFYGITSGISRIIQTWKPTLLQLDKKVITERRNKQNRTIKQILGHLIDSASNNHQRMVRLQYNQALTFPDYRQDNDLWIKIQQYQQADWTMMVQLWENYNQLIIHIINSVDQSKLQNSWNDFEGTNVTLEKMIIDYLAHLHLHINEIDELIKAAK